MDTNCRVLEYNLISGAINVNVDKECILSQRFEKHLKITITFESEGADSDINDLLNKKLIKFAEVELNIRQKDLHGHPVSIPSDHLKRTELNDDRPHGKDNNPQSCHDYIPHGKDNNPQSCHDYIPHGKDNNTQSCHDYIPHGKDNNPQSCHDYIPHGKDNNPQSLHHFGELSTHDQFSFKDQKAFVDDDRHTFQQIATEDFDDSVLHIDSEKEVLIDDAKSYCRKKRRKKMGSGKSSKKCKQIEKHPQEVTNKGLAKKGKQGIRLKIKKEKVVNETQPDKVIQHEDLVKDSLNDTGTICKKVNVYNKSKIVKKWAIEKDVTCDFCHGLFKSQQEFFNHRKSIRTEFTCLLCGKVMPFQAHLMVHMHMHNKSMLDAVAISDTEVHKLILNSSVHGDFVSGEAQSERGVKGVKCDVCSSVMSNIPILKTHAMTHTGEMAYKCCVCDEGTHSIARYNNHMMTHAKGGQVQCKVCQLFFMSRGQLSKHQLTHDVKCGLCAGVFPNKTSRAFHYKVAHKDDILKCLQCGKMFSSEEELQTHLNYHKNRTKTQCPVCGVFVSRLENHMISHNETEQNIQVYSCDKCHRQFKQKLSFQRHLLVHSKDKLYACMECPKTFSRSGGLRRHMITHCQEKPYVCDICGKACSQMGNLKIHMQIHKTDASTLICSQCQQTFNNRTLLEDHIFSAHSDQVFS